MSDTPPRPEERERAEPLDHDTILHRILAAVERDRRRGGLELAIAIILSLATLSSTWCGYQANSWNGLQSGKQAAANVADRQAGEDTIVGLQVRTFDGIEVINYWTALRQKDAQAAEALLARMRPELRKAIESSLAEGVLTNPKVAGPLQRPEYILEAERNAKSRRADAARLQADADAAGQAAGSYITLTLVFASVLFFGGITGTFTSARVRMGLACIALTIFLIAVVTLARLPLCRG